MTIIPRPSPNQFAAKSRSIRYVVVHATAGATAEGAISWMCRPETKRSCHYLVDKDGTVYRLVDDCLVAYHAGSPALWNGETEINLHSIGIELVNLNDGRDVYPERQVNALTELVRQLMKTYGVLPVNVVRHLDVSGPEVRKPGCGREAKTDPAGFPWEGWKELLEV